MDILSIFILCALIVMAVISIANTLSFPRLKPISPEKSPFISLLVPARDESAVIGETVQRLLRQDYPHYELLLLDDASSDGTLEVAMQAAGDDPRLRLFQGQPLPTGWTGKNWACHQLAQAARGEVLVFTDADVRWEPGALRSLAGWMRRTHAETFSVWPTQETVTWSERLVVPMMNFAILAYLPELGVRYTPWKSMAAANGQCLAFRREAYIGCGGHVAVRSNIVEDVALARRAKAQGLRLVMALGEGQIGGRMYTSWQEVRDGFAKNILAGHGDLPAILILAALFHWVVFIVPWILLAAILTAGNSSLLTPLAMIVLGFGVRALSAALPPDLPAGANLSQRLLGALLLPVSVVMMSIIAWQSLWWHYHQGGPQWKGRTVEKARNP
jgi:chlorobactene glucosyltransferase